MANRAVRRLPIPLGDEHTSIIAPRFPEMPMIRSIGLTQVGPAWSNQPHAHAEYEIHFIRRGRGTLLAHGRRFAVASGDIYLFRPSETHGGSADPSDPSQVLFMAFTVPASLLGAVFTSVRGKPVFLHEDVRELRASLRALGDALAALHPSGARLHTVDRLPVPVIAAALRVLADLLQPAQGATAQSGTARERALAEEILRRIEVVGPRRAVTLRSLAEGVHVTAAHLGSVLRLATGKTYPRILAELRVRHALALLEDPLLPVREVARAVGLSSPRALAKVFQRVTGKTPRRFRAE